MHAWVSHTSADTHGCPLHQEPLDFLRASFKYKLCDTNSSDLSVWSSFAPFGICTAVPNGLPVLAFANSKHSHSDSKWFQASTSLIRKDAFSTNSSLPSFHRNWSLIGREKSHCWYWHNRAMAMSVKSCIKVHWLHLVSGQASSSASKTCPILAWACAWERVTCVTASHWKMALRSEEKHRTRESLSKW